jgi:Putative zinc-finger
MPHIPEDELHAYLDQALSRSQCVEIESHLAVCPRCQSQRDGIAALRDRTTALLSVLAPPVTLPPGIETIRARALGVAHGRQRATRAGIWAASLLAALGLGWTANMWLDHSGEAPGRNLGSAMPPGSAAAQLSPVPDSSQASFPSPVETVRRDEPTPALRRVQEDPAPRPIPPIQAATRDLTDSVPIMQTVAVDPLPSLASDSARFATNSGILSGDQSLGETEGMWRIVTIGDAEQESGAPVASVPGLPVVQVKVQGVLANQRIVAVEQQLATGEVIRTIEGPAAQMSDLIARDGQRAADGTLASNALEALMTMRFGDRMVAIRGPADSVRALMSRLAVPPKKP